MVFNTLSIKSVNQINSSSFLLGAVLGGLAIFTIAADSQHPPHWQYQAVQGDLQYNVPWAYSALLNQTATNGWELVSAQLFPPADPNDLKGAHAYMVLRRAQ